MKKVNNMMNAIGFIKTIIYVFFVFNVASLHASTGHKLPLSKIIKSSDLIVAGVFSSTNTKWRNNKIFTTGVFDVKNTLKGENVNSVLIEYPGGTAQHPVLKTLVTLKTSNGVSFSTGEEFVLILKRLSNSKYQIIGSQGKLAVTSNNKEKIIKGMKKIHGKVVDGSNEVVVTSKWMTVLEFTKYVNELLSNRGHNEN